MKNISFWHVVLFVFLCSSCSSPEDEGKKLAQRMNECAESFIKEKQKAETDFVSHFNASDYHTRAEALEAYDQAMIKVLDDYNVCHDDVAVERSEIAGGYANDYKKMAAFETAYDSNIDSELNDRLLDAIAETDYPIAVLAKVKTVIPSKPSVAQIQQDLVGHQLAEGFEKEKCWFHEDWRWKIDEGEIHDFKIEKVLRDDEKKYVFVATMRLDDGRKAFNSRAKVSYWLPDAEDWQLEFVNSMGMSIVKTHEYDECVSYEIEDDGWGGVNALFISNKTELELVVGVEIVASGKKLRCSTKVSPNSKAQVGGFLMGGNVTSYEKGFVERF